MQVLYIVLNLKTRPTHLTTYWVNIRGLFIIGIVSPPTSIRVRSALEVTYTQVWYIIGIVSSSPTDFHSEKIGLIRVTYDPPVSIMVNKYLKSRSFSLSLVFFPSLSLLVSDLIM